MFPCDTCMYFKITYLLCIASEVPQYFISNAYWNVFENTNSTVSKTEDLNSIT